ncbi:MAG: hypothetical protein GF313_14695 [Caldithrix sp.]|nr:hypothetical protein [Caldithrix sp.]
MANFRQIRTYGSIILVVFLITIGLVLLNQPSVDTDGRALQQGQPDRCMDCHSDESGLSSSHDPQGLGCYRCHLGNPHAADKDNAHAGMVVNPSDLRWADKTCGRQDCHPVLAKRVQKSIMSTNAGLVTSTLFQWDSHPTPDDSTMHITHLKQDTSLAASHIRKLCAGCHVNKPQDDFPGEIGQRGGGCNDCHISENTPEDKHPKLTVDIGIGTCEKCHNRSNRTALTYQGKYESEGYGAPFRAGNPSAQSLSGERYYYHLPADIHYEAGMTCIDCHVAEGIMGDGHRYAHLEDQVYIGCTDCHQAQWAKPDSAHLVWKMIEVHAHVPMPQDSVLARTRRGSYFPNLRRTDQGVELVVKSGGKKLSVKQVGDKASCTMPGHERMACQSCHSAYTPQCYGCHDTYDPAGRQFDKLTGQETPGRWTEGRSYLRFEEPALGLDKENRVMPFAPGCQVYLTELDEDSRVRKQRTWLTMAPFDPHSTRTKTPSCADCHSLAKRMGMGKGALRKDGRSFDFEPLYDSRTAGLGSTPLESMVTVDGRKRQRMSRLQARPFNARELKDIYRVSLCIVCHDGYDDPIYANFNQSIHQFNQQSDLPCRTLE